MPRRSGRSPRVCPPATAAAAAGPPPAVDLPVKHANGSAAALRLCRLHERSYARCDDADERPANTQEEPIEDEVGDDLSDEYSDDEDAGLSCRVP